MLTNAFQEDLVAERSDNFTIRLATSADIPALRELIDQSVRVLQREDYSAEQLDAALGTAYGVDTQLIADETYYVVEAVGAADERVLAACGGWSMRKTLYGSDHGPYRNNSMLDPARDAAKIRAFFVHPEVDAARDCQLDSENLRRCRLCTRIPAI